VYNKWNEFQIFASRHLPRGVNVSDIYRSVNRGTKVVLEWTSAAGLVYGQRVVKGIFVESRIQHVLAHGYKNIQKTTHSLFNVRPRNIIKLVDEAWLKRGAHVPGNPNKFIVDMGRTIGTKGERNITLIVDSSSNRIITAFPSL